MRPVLIKPAGGAFWKSFLPQTIYTRPRTSRRRITSSSGVSIVTPRRWTTSSYSDVSTCKPNPHYSTYINYGSYRADSANLEALKADGKSRFFVALGSNVGDRLDMIEKGCLEMEKEEIQIFRTSGLWETKAMYVEDQANFLNGVCEVSQSLYFQKSCTKGVLTMRVRQVISTDKDPEALLIKLKRIEERLGRVKLIDKGPRSIDLDVLLWNHESFEKEGPKLPISVPHKLMREREFVLRPLCE